MLYLYRLLDKREARESREHVHSKGNQFMNRPTHMLAVLMALSIVFPVAFTSAQPTLFAALPRPNGLTTDPNGNVLVVADTTFARVLVALAPNGSLIGQMPMPGTSISDTTTHNLVFDPVIGWLWDLKGNGDLLLMNLATGQVQPLFNIGTLPVDISAVYDVATGTIGPLSGIVPQTSVYGDLAVLWRGEVLDLFVTGRSVVFPFVMRIRFVQGNFSSARVLVSTNAPESVANLPRGVAVNAQGIVLTTVPIASFGESVYAFLADFPEVGNGFPVVLLGGVLSSGMTTDVNGNFYIAGQNVVCGGDTNALIVLFAALNDGRCLPSGGGLFGSGYDVAVSPALNVAYTTLGDAVLAWPLGGVIASSTR
jgi:hypothetical protein